jgi:predicted nucleotidyltransferase
MIAGVPQVERLILFGSRALGDHDERSDLDVAVSAPDLDRAGLAALRDKLNRFRTLYKISLTPIESMPPRLRDRVLAQGVVLYERQEAEG